MYILELTRGIPLPTQPLLGCFEYDQAKAIGKLGNKVIILSIDLRSILRKRKYGLSIFSQEGVKVYNFAFPIGNIPNAFFALFCKLFGKMIFKKILKIEGKPDIIHCHFCFLQGYIGAILKKQYGIPLVITEHSSELIKDFNKARYSYYAYGYNNADKIISVGNGLKKAIYTRFGSQSVVIPNIVDLSIFSYKKKKKSNTFKFISVGSLFHGKGFDVLLRAFAKLNDKATSLTIIGDGPERNNLEILVKDLGIEEQVVFTGYLSRNLINSYIVDSQVFVLTSRYETFGVVYIEALSTGTPVIATRCGGPEDIVTKDNGLLVDVEDIDQTASAMMKIKSDYLKYNRERISFETKKIYSPNKIGEMLVKEFEALV